MVHPQGGEFMNEICAELTKMSGITRTTTLGYSPRSNGLAEQTNREIIAALQRKVKSPSEWDQMHNISVNATTRELPCLLVFGRNSNFPLTVAPNYKPSPTR